MLWSIKQVGAVGREGFTTIHTPCMVPLCIQSDSCLCTLGHTLCSEPARTAAWSLAVVMK